MVVGEDSQTGADDGGRFPLDEQPERVNLAGENRLDHSAIEVGARRWTHVFDGANPPPACGRCMRGRLQGHSGKGLGSVVLAAAVGPAAAMAGIPMVVRRSG